MKILLLQIGKTKERAYQEIEAEFLKRLKPFTAIETVVIETSDQKTENLALQAKLTKITRKNGGEYSVVALDLSGQPFSSKQFADFLRQQRDYSGGKLAFIIGGPHGFVPEILLFADVVLSLSRMTFTHQMVRLFLLEQIYRGFMILAGKKYHY